MNSIEEVRKILVREGVYKKKLSRDFIELGRHSLAKELCQLFEPDYLKMSHEANMRYGIPKTDIKAGESRLVEEYMMLLQTQNGGKVIVDTRPALIRQDTKTASIKDTECQAKLERIRRGIEKISLLGNAGGKVVILSEDWQEYWKQEGVK